MPPDIEENGIQVSAGASAPLGDESVVGAAADGNAAPDANADVLGHEDTGRQQDGAKVNGGANSLKDELYTQDTMEESDSDKSVSALYTGIGPEKVAEYFSSNLLFKAQKHRSKLNADKRKRARRHMHLEEAKEPGLGLVKSLFDYFRVFEDRIEALSQPSIAQKAAELKEAELKEAVSHGNDEPEIALTIKYFDAAAYLTDNGLYPELKEEPEPGTFFCGRDTQNFIRALYIKLRNDGLKPQKSADSTDPKPGEIDLLTFGVTSEVIAAFFSKELGINAEGEGLIRFGKPFRALIRNHGAIKSQLQKLEQSYGQVATETLNKDDEPIVQSQEASQPAKEQGSDLTSSLRTANNAATDIVEAYNRPDAVATFRKLEQFIDMHLSGQIALYERLKSGEEEQVAFENLWMLFDTRETIFCPSRELKSSGWYNTDIGEIHTPVARYTPQAYRVVSTSGGLPLEEMMHLRHKAKGGDDYVALDETVVAAGNATGAAVLANMLNETIRASGGMRNSFTNFEVYCCYVDFDGREFGTVRDVFVFRPFERKVDIRSLQAYPARYLNQDNLQHRGNNFLDVTRISHLQYEGLTLGPIREEVNGPVVVDMSIAFEKKGDDDSEAVIVAPSFDPVSSLWLGGNSGEVYDLFGTSSCPYKWCYSRKCTSNAYIDYQREQREKVASEIKVVLEEYENEAHHDKSALDMFKKSLENKDIMRLLPGVVPGFVLRNRKWVLLSLIQLGLLETSNQWDKLVLPRGYRDMVQAMVETHTRDPGSELDTRISMDLVKGKGRGCVILLHGVPGVGKTSTAECVAAHTKKPLYPITCGDIGYQPDAVELNMEKHFKLAHKWGCVLLLDEAEVFLAKRDPRDAKRNSLVSVFLRILEYYSGILFLTTNRVGAIDDAFRSRLHLILYYPPLNYKQAKKIFKQNFERIADVNEIRKVQKLLPFEYKESEDKIMRWAKGNWPTMKWNGRQIRNTFQTALALAEFKSKAGDSTPTSLHLKRMHFEIVATASRQFNDYLLETHGMDEEKTAKHDLMRAHGYVPADGLQFKSLWGSSSDTTSDEESKDNSNSESDGDSSDETEKEKKRKAKKKKRKEAALKKSGSEKKGTSSRKRKADTKKDTRGESDDSL